MDQATTLDAVHGVLRDDLLALVVHTVTLVERPRDRACEVTCEVSHGEDGPRTTLRGEGVGFIDAAFHAFQAAYSREYPSLASIRFAGFSIQGDLTTRRGELGSDAEGTITLEVENNRGRRFTFAESSRSITAGALACVVAATEYFVNTERAFVKLHHALTDARERNREDLAERYRLQLAGLVENTSYSEVIERLRASEG